MSEHFPEKPSTSANISSSDQNAEVLQFSIELADTPAELRMAFAENHQGQFSDISKSTMQRLAEVAVGKLYSLGLNMDDKADQRIGGVLKGIEAISTSDQFGSGRNHTIQKPESTFFEGYHRLLSAIDTESDTRLQLLPQSELVTKSLLSEIASSALKFTEGDEYTQPHRYSRKAGRRVTDPNSPFWHCGIATDDNPGKTFGSPYINGPNVWVWVPTGLLTDEAVRGLGQLDYLRNYTWEATSKAGYIPARIVAQSLRLGVPTQGQDQVDTADHFVAKFLKYTEVA